MYRKHLAIFIILFALAGCGNNSSVDVSNIEVNSKLIRFDSLFYKSDKLSELKAAYPKMFAADVDDSVWVNKQNNAEELRILAVSDSVHGDFSVQYAELTELFKHLKYYFPKFIAPDVYTVLSDYDYQYPVLYSAGRLFVSLDMYLGADFADYNSFPKYIRQNFNKERISVDAGEAILRTFVSKDVRDKTLLSEMIYNGKLMYINSLLNEGRSENEIMGYSSAELQWCEKNERDIWEYFVKNQMLYSSDIQLKKRFIDPAPFSKFFLELDRESPGRVGVWLGYQIVKSYMDNNDVNPEELIKNRDAKSIFVKSKYKPRKQ